MSIDDRATKASDVAKIRFENDDYWSSYADEIVTSAYEVGHYQGYIKGDADRKAIDIEKACKWLYAVNWNEYVSCNEAMRVAVHKLVTAFRKAMEDA